MLAVSSLITGVDTLRVNRLRADSHLSGRRSFTTDAKSSIADDKVPCRVDKLSGSDTKMDLIDNVTDEIAERN